MLARALVAAEPLLRRARHAPVLCLRDVGRTLGACVFGGGHVGWVGGCYVFNLKVGVIKENKENQKGCKTYMPWAGCRQYKAHVPV